MSIVARNSIENQTKALADAWRILGRLGLVDTIFNHISVTTTEPSEGSRLLMNPAGQLPSNISPRLVRAFPLKEYTARDAERLGVNSDGLRLHSAMHKARMKPGAIIHTHSPFCIAVGCSKNGLLPLSQTSMEFIGETQMVDYGGVFRSRSLPKQITQVASKGGVALLRHHGALIVADSIPEALYLAYYIEEACKIQVLTLSQGVPIVMPNRRAISTARQALRDDRLDAAVQLFEAFRKTL